MRPKIQCFDIDHFDGVDLTHKPQSPLVINRDVYSPPLNAGRPPQDQAFVDTKLSIIQADEMENFQSSYKSSNMIEESGEIGKNLRKIMSHGTVEEDVDGESEKTPLPSQSKFAHAQQE